MRRSGAVVLLLAFTALAEEPDWWSIERDVVAQLLARDAGAWALALDAAGTPAAVGARMTCFQVFARAGHEKGQRRAIRFLRDLEPDRQARAIDFLIGREDWAMARFAMEQWPAARPGWAHVFVREWARRAKPERIDAWLAEQSRRSRHWTLERLRFRAKLGKAAELVALVEAAVRRRPTDLDGVRFYIDMLDAADVKRDLGWIAREVRPRLASDTRDLGMRLLGRAPRVGIALLERAATQPLTDQDRLYTAVSLTPDDFEQRFRDGVKVQLMRAYLRVGEAARSQKLLEELSARYPDGIPTGLLGIAGQVQGASGARVIERRVRAAGDINENDPLYWLGRARYFAGRKNHDEAEAAFKQAWQRRTDATTDRIVNDHAHYRFRVGGKPAALALLRARIEEVELDGPHAAAIVGRMLYHGDDRSPFPRPGEDLWWRYLESHAVWGAGSEGRLLRDMAVRVAKNDREGFWKRAEGLAADSHPSRARRVGEAMTRCGAHRRAIPLLLDAIRRLENESERQGAQHTCYRAYLAAADWKSAEALFPSVQVGWTAREVVEQCSRLALAAARAGARADAMRIWSVRTNLDCCDLRYIDDMAAAGLRRDLVALYRRVGAARALAQLAATSPK